MGGLASLVTGSAEEEHPSPTSEEAGPFARGSGHQGPRITEDTRLWEGTLDGGRAPRETVLLGEGASTRPAEKSGPGGPGRRLRVPSGPGEDLMEGGAQWAAPRAGGTRTGRPAKLMALSRSEKPVMGPVRSQRGVEATLRGQ